MQWLQNPNQSNVVNLNNVRSKDSRRFSKKYIYIHIYIYIYI